MPSDDNKRIAKNTMFLYIRMIVSIVLNLYTMRLLWNVLGIDDYGIYNVVGGIVMMFAFLNNAMVASSQRYISFELGKGNLDRLRKTFSMSLTVHFLLAIAVLILAETIGLWFLNHKLNIPHDRLVAANWVYQCSILSFLFTIISVPYNACIVAHEHMKVYGYLGIVEVVLKLAAVVIAMVIPVDTLISYAVLILLLSVTMRIIYGIYCNRHFPECHFIKSKDNNLLKDMFSFAGWSFIGNMGFSVRDQGLNIVINMFFNVAVNAAKGIATNVSQVINGFAYNFTMAVNPQITKRYAIGDIESMLQLVFNGCKYSLILMSIVVIPLVICAEPVLKIWLGNVAPFTVGFLQLSLIMSLIDCVVSPITTSLQATGKIKKFQIVVSIIMLLNLPTAWIWLKFDNNPFIVMFVCIITSILALAARVILLHELIHFSYIEFLKKVYSRSIPSIMIASIISFLIYGCFSENLFGIIGFALSSLIILALTIYFIALNHNEKSLVVNMIRQRIRI